MGFLHPRSRIGCQNSPASLRSGYSEIAVIRSLWHDLVGRYVRDDDPGAGEGDAEGDEESGEFHLAICTGFFGT